MKSGLNIDPQHEAIENIALNLDKMRNERAEKISQKLAKKGIHGALEFVQKVVGDGMITRTHFANFLVAHCHADTQQQAFDRFLGDGKVAFVSTTWTPFDVAIKSIVNVESEVFTILNYWLHLKRQVVKRWKW